MIVSMRCTNLGSIRAMPWRRTILGALFVFNSRSILFAKITRKDSASRQLAMGFIAVRFGGLAGGASRLRCKYFFLHRFFV